jgi:hypothetical protein
MITRLFTLLFFVTVISGQTPAPPEVHVKLSLAENKTVYRIGEPIRIAMDFAADREGYLVEVTSEGNDLLSDKILISPETGITHWYLELMDNRYGGRDYFGYEKLTSSPRRLEIVLNDSLRFDNPGRYTVSVTTSRLRKPAKDPYGEPFTITTNAISFEVQSMSDEDEAKEVKRLSDLLNATRESRAGEPIAKRLAYLTGEPSTREKVRRFIDSDERTDSYRYTIYNGLFIARNRALVLKLIETALRDPNIPATSLMLGAACRLGVLLNYGVSERPVGPVIGVLQPQEDPRNREVREAYLAELAAGLGKRNGNSLTTTATTILSSIWPQSKSDSPDAREARNVLVQQFDTLHPFTQEWLLRQYWNQMRDPLLIPSLKKMLTATTSVGDKNLHETALLRLLEMAPDEVRPFVIAEIRNPNSFQEAETLGKLKDDSLPEVDASLLEQIRKLTQSTDNRARVLLRLKTQLLSRFATDRIYGELMQLYREMGANLPREARPGLLAYFAKHNEREAMPLIEQAVADLQPGESPQLLSDVTKLYYSDAIGELLNKLMEKDDPAMASYAAYLIGVHGKTGDEKLLEARLKRWQEQWRDRVAEADAKQQGQIERELVYALVNGKSWKLSPERVRELRTSCLTKMCKQNNVVSQ